MCPRPIPSAWRGPAYRGHCSEDAPNRSGLFASVCGGAHPCPSVRARHLLTRAPMFEIARGFLFVFGVASIGGGVVGFVKAQSKASLIAGGASGALLIGAGVLASVGQPRTARARPRRVAFIRPRRPLHPAVPQDEEGHAGRRHGGPVCDRRPHDRAGAPRQVARHDHRRLGRARRGAGVERRVSPRPRAQRARRADPDVARPRRGDRGALAVRPRLPVRVGDRDRRRARKAPREIDGGDAPRATPRRASASSPMPSRSKGRSA